MYLIFLIAFERQLLFFLVGSYKLRQYDQTNGCSNSMHTLVHNGIPSASWLIEEKIASEKTY